VAGVAAIVWQVRSAMPPGRVVPEAYYTTDGGKTFFADTEERVPPFDHNGQEAVRAMRFKCGGTEFVGYLQRFNADAKKTLEEVAEFAKTAKKGDKPPAAVFRADGASRGGREVRRLGDTKWYNFGSTEGSKIMDVKCPDGSAGTPEPVVP
jgi:hypothetical protein